MSVKLTPRAESYARAVGLDADEIPESVGGSDGEVTAGELQKALGQQNDKLAGAFRQATSQRSNGGASLDRLPDDGGALMKDLFELQGRDDVSDAAKANAKHTLVSLLNSSQTRSKAVDQLTQLLRETGDAKLRGQIFNTAWGYGENASGALGAAVGRAIAEPNKGLSDSDKMQRSTEAIASTGSGRVSHRNELLNQAMEFLGHPDSKAHNKKKFVGALLRGSPPSMKSYRAQGNQDGLFFGPAPTGGQREHARKVVGQLQDARFGDGAAKSLEPLFETAKEAAWADKVVGQGLNSRPPEEATRVAKWSDTIQDDMKAEFQQKMSTYLRGADRANVNTDDLMRAIKNRNIDDVIGLMDNPEEKMSLMARLSHLKGKALEHKDSSFYSINTDGYADLVHGINQLKKDPEVRAEMQSIKADAAKAAIPGASGQNIAEIRDYFTSDTFRRRLESMSGPERKKTVSEFMNVLGTLEPKEAKKSFIEFSAKGFRSQAPEQLAKLDARERREGLTKALASVAGNAKFASGTLKKVSGTLSDLLDARGVQELSGGGAMGIDYDKLAENLHEQLAGTLGQGELKRVTDFVDDLRDSGKLGMVVAGASAMTGAQGGDDVQLALGSGKSMADVLAQSGDVTEFLGRATGYLDETGELTMKGMSSGFGRFADSMNTLGEWAGPAGDVIGAAADGYNAYQAAVEKHDAGEASANVIKATGGVVAAGLTLAGSTWWTGAGAVVGLGTAAVGWGVEQAFGDSEAIEKLKKAGVIID